MCVLCFCTKTFGCRYTHQTCRYYGIGHHPRDPVSASYPIFQVSYGQLHGTSCSHAFFSTLVTSHIRNHVCMYHQSTLASNSNSQYKSRCMYNTKTPTFLFSETQAFLSRSHGTYIHAAYLPAFPTQTALSPLTRKSNDNIRRTLVITSRKSSISSDRNRDNP